jgi:RNA polymerase sigma-70 factor (ECF subfamily)
LTEAEPCRLLEARDYHAAFEWLLEHFRDKVFRLACGLLQDESQAEDMTQDIFLRIWKGLPGYHGQASLSTWIYAIARNACFTELKRRAARPTVSLDDPGWEHAANSLPAPRPADAEAGAESDVRVLLARLPEKYRQVITLFYLEQKAYDEVAALLGMPLGTVKTFLFRARRELCRLAARSPVLGVSNPIRHPHALSQL